MFLVLSEQRSKDRNIFYHSQLHIWVECIFGMLVHRWGIGKEMPHNILVKRIIGIVNASEKLCNFCIDESGPSEAVPELLSRDPKILLLMQVVMSI